MRIKTSFILLLIITILPTSCQHKSQEKKQTVVEMDMASYESINFNTLVETISCCKLTESNNILSCKKIIQWDDHYYLLTDRDVFIFDDKGKLVKKISSKDPNIFFLSTLFIHPTFNELWVIGNSDILYVYGLNGEFIDQRRMPFACADLISIKDYQFLVYDGGLNKNWNCLVALTDFTKIEKKFVPKSISNKSQFISQSMFSRDIRNENILMQLFENDTIYSFNTLTETFNPLLHLNFHGDFLTEQMYPVKGFTDEEMGKMIDEREYIFAIYSFHIASGRLFFKLAGKRNDFCIINLDTHLLQSFDALFDGFQPRNYNPIIGSDGENLYCIVNEKDMVEHYQQNDCTFPDINDLLSTLSINGNSWILLKIKIKQ